jgi:hypothetical protein
MLPDPPRVKLMLSILSIDFFYRGAEPLGRGNKRRKMADRVGAEA